MRLVGRRHSHPALLGVLRRQAPTAPNSEEVRGLSVTPSLPRPGGAFCLSRCRPSLSRIPHGSRVFRLLRVESSRVVGDTCGWINPCEK